MTAAAGAVPAYLGPQLGAVPALGELPDRAAVAEAAPQLVLATPGTAKSVKALRDSGALGAARVVTVQADDPTEHRYYRNWRTVFTEVAEALNRTAAGAERLQEFDAEAARAGRRMDASHNQVSLVRFTTVSGIDAEDLQGTDNFGASIMGLVGVQRPASQRRTGPVSIDDATFADADGDLILVSAADRRALEHAESVLESDEWLDLGAPSWGRVFWIDDEIWYRSSGLAAAWLVLNDLKSSV
ncbi:ABC transporter substrate-binding protein [Gordonia sp. (in: high G+C Gram-positive bacteria)]|uniref:ABC transporter substrate-binding protein n=1 Tax=Gordonia sp. (in: high G+C Gram-positive bacteria) TaxID=84139 RepID=UPI0039E667DD